MKSRSIALVCTMLALVSFAAACSSDDGDPQTSDDTPEPASMACEWPMFGRDTSRTFSYPSDCETTISTDTVGRLQQQWFRKTSDVVTATPAVADDTAYVGYWSGKFYAISTTDGSIRWTYTAEPHKNVYSGQIVASAAVADIDGERRVVFASGKTVYALRADDGTLRWQHELNPEGDENDLTEIQSSPLVTNGMVIVGYDGHDTPGTRAGLIALDAATGDERWNFDSDRGRPATGCGGVWSSPSVDTDLGLVFAGTANCPSSPTGWNKYSEAIFAVDLDTGSPEWSFQPRGPSNYDFDFAGAPNVFEAQGKAVVGLGGKDGVYYALERATGKLVWKRTAAPSRVQGKNYSTGGFIGATAVGEGLVVGGTAIGGPCPCLHGLNAENGEIEWQQPDAGPTYAPSSIVNGVAFAGSTTDFTLRALDVESGEVLWSQPLAGGIAGGAVVSGDTVVAVAGIREPGVDPAGTESGVYGFEVGPPGATTTTEASSGTLPPTTVAPPPTAPDPNAPTEPECIGQPCALNFNLVEPPAGRNPSMTVHLRPSPFRVEVRADDLGDPDAWIRGGADKDAITYGVFVSDDSLKGTLLCVLDGNYDCVSEVVPDQPDRKYNRISVLAIENTPKLPAASEGFNQLVTTTALDQPVSFS